MNQKLINFRTLSQQQSNAKYLNGDIPSITPNISMRYPYLNHTIKLKAVIPERNILLKPTQQCQANQLSMSSIHWTTPMRCRKLAGKQIKLTNADKAFFEMSIKFKFLVITYMMANSLFLFISSIKQSIN